MKNPPIMFWLPEYEHIGKPLRKSINCLTGHIKRESFPDGELGLTIETSIEGQDVILVGGTWNDSSTLQMYDLGCAISKYGARSLTMIIPYYGCSTMERATKPGVVVTAKTRARLLSAIPQTHAGNRIVLLDLHSEGIPHYFEGAVTAIHLYAKPVILKAIQQIIQYHAGGNGFINLETVLASTDAGRAKWVESLASDMGLPAAFILKRRDNGTDTKVLAVTADVKNKLVIIYDDMIRTGGSLIKAADAYLAAGAKKIAVVATHGVFPAGAYERLKESNKFVAIGVTDSHPNAMKEPNLTVLSTVELFADHLRGTMHE